MAAEAGHADWEAGGEESCLEVGNVGSFGTLVVSRMSIAAPILAGVKTARPNVAVVCNSLPPYRVHAHQRIAREMGEEIKLWTVCTHETTGDRWEFVAPPEINVVSFGKGHTVARQGSARHAFSEWTKGGRIIDWMIEHDVRAVIMVGYNDPGRLRIIRWCHRHDVPLFLWGDSNIFGDTATGMKARIKKMVVGRVVAACTGTMPCGSCGAAYFEKYGAAKDRIFCSPYEPDYQLIMELPAEFIERARQEYSLPRERRRFVFSARVVSVKRPDLMIDAFVAVADQRAEWDLLMVGDGELREEMQRRVPERLAKRVIWTGFLSDQAVISALYRLSDCLVLPSDFEPWAVVINEAAAAGIAIVSTNIVGAAHELVRDGVNGRMVPPGDLGALTEAMLGVSQRERIDSLKAGSVAVLEDWRRRGDPIEGIRRALRFCRVI
jgi:glycosyltransferase involved in cell wall biosynthesis